jgi:pilus assembly protein CpaB
MAYVDSRTIRAAEREKVLGLRTLAPLEAQNVLMWNDLAVVAEERRDLSALVTPGLRAVYIRAMREEQAAPLVNPGDYVDVIATLPPAEGRSERTTSVVLLQKVLVLASGNKTSADDGLAGADKHAVASSSSREQGLTLSLNLQQAQTIALAVERGHLSVALRSPDDQRTVEGIPELSESALLDSRSVAGSALAQRPQTPVRLKDAVVGGGAAR